MAETKEKSIVLAVTGSIAAFRSCELVRNLSKKGYPVRVILTANAANFVGRITFEALSGHPVYMTEWENGMLHIELKNQAGVFAVVPASANIIGKMASGIADDLVSTSYLAMRCPVIVAPAMNPNMYSSKAVQRNLQTLKNDGVIVLDPSEGEVVCGDEGQGKLAAIEQIEKEILTRFKR